MRGVDLAMCAYTGEFSPSVVKRMRDDDRIEILNVKDRPLPMSPTKKNVEFKIVE